MEAYRERLENTTLAKNFRDPNYDKDEKLLKEIDIEVSQDINRNYRRVHRIL